MADERIDALIRRLDVPSEPPPAFVDASFRLLQRVAQDELRRERRPLGRFARAVAALRPAGDNRRAIPSSRALVAAAVLALLAMGLALAILGGVGRPPESLPPPFRHVLFGRENLQAGGFDAFVIGADGTAERLLLPAPRDVSRPSHDGRWIASAVVVPGGRVVPEVIDAGGGEARRLLADATLSLGAMAWSHDGRWLAFEGWDDTDPDLAGIYVVRADGRELRRLTGPGVPGDFSPNDRQLVLERPEGLFVVGIDGTREAQVGTLKPGQSAGYLPDGRSLYAVADGSIWIIDLASGDATEIRVPNGSAASARLSPEAARFVLTYDPNDGTTTSIAVVDRDGANFHVLVDESDLGEVWPDWLP